jgi:periplasmic divalent cation tolerance protein
VTVGSVEDGARIARVLVEERLAACVNLVDGIRSIYRWQGTVSDDRECLMLVKARAERFPELERRIRELHGYEVPEVIALDVTAGSAPYLEWLAANS